MSSRERERADLAACFYRSRGLKGSIDFTRGRRSLPVNTNLSSWLASSRFPFFVLLLFSIFLLGGDLEAKSMRNCWRAGRNLEGGPESGGRGSCRGQAKLPQKRTLGMLELPRRESRSEVQYTKYSRAHPNCEPSPGGSPEHPKNTSRKKPGLWPNGVIDLLNKKPGHWPKAC